MGLRMETNKDCKWTVKDLYHELPEVIKTLLLTSEGWLVGSAPQQMMVGVEPNDFDIIVPSRELFQKVVKQLYSYGQQLDVNSYGGIKASIECENNTVYVIDVWCEELDHFLLNATGITYVFNYKRRMLLKQVNEN